MEEMLAETDLALRSALPLVRIPRQNQPPPTTIALESVRRKTFTVQKVLNFNVESRKDPKTHLRVVSKTAISSG